MKNLTEYIIEKKNNFILDDSDRNALIELVGTCIGTLGEDNDISIYEPFMQTLSNNEKDILVEFYGNILSDYQTYPKIRSSIISKEEYDILVKLFDWLEQNNLTNHNWDLINIIEKFK